MGWSWYCISLSLLLSKISLSPSVRKFQSSPSLCPHTYTYNSPSTPGISELQRAPFPQNFCDSCFQVSQGEALACPCQAVPCPCCQNPQQCLSSLLLSLQFWSTLRLRGKFPSTPPQIPRYWHFVTFVFCFIILSLPLAPSHPPLSFCISFPESFESHM